MEEESRTSTERKQMSHEGETQWEPGQNIPEIRGLPVLSNLFERCNQLLTTEKHQSYFTNYSSEELAHHQVLSSNAKLLRPRVTFSVTGGGDILTLVEIKNRVVVV